MKKGNKMKHELSDINPQKMDSQKWDMLLNLLEHPEKYSETQKDELLGDEEVNELYQQLIETRQSLDFAKSKEGMKMPSIDAEWEKLKDEMKLKEEKQQKEEMSQNAETQQTAKLFPLWSPMRKVAAVAAVLVVSGITFAAIHLVTRSHQASDKNNTELVASRKDSIQQVSAPQKSNIAKQLALLLPDGEARQRMLDGYEDVRRKIGGDSPSESAAHIIYDLVK